MFNVYTTQRGSHVVHGAVAYVSDAKALAHANAELGHDVLVRLFKQVDHADSVTGECFETAFSVLDGRVAEHRSVTIPTRHW